MRALMMLVFAAAHSLPQDMHSLRSKFKLADCHPTKPWTRQNEWNEGTCTAVASAATNGKFLKCALPLTMRGMGLVCTENSSRRKHLKAAREGSPSKKNVTLYLDNKFRLLFKSPEWLEGGYNGRIECSSALAISYKEASGEKCEEENLLSQIRMFKGLQQNDGLPTEFEVVDSFRIGSVLVDENCNYCEGGKHPTCRIIAKIHLKESKQANGDLSFTGELIDASIENKLIDDHSQALEFRPLQFETKELSKIYNTKSSIIMYNTANRWQAVLSVMFYFKNINSLNISGSPIKYFGTLILMRMHQLRELTASSCTIRIVDEGAFKDNALLTKIDLSKNELNTLPMGLLKDLKLLTHLDISHNKFTHGQAFDFYPHSKWPDCGMQLLDMSSNALERAANVIGFESKVKHVNLADNLLKDLSAMMTKERIKELNLSGNRITTLSRSSLEILDMVEYVNLTNNLFDCGSCYLLDFQIWLNSTGRKILSSPPENLGCTTPSHLRQQKKKVLEVEYNVRSCSGWHGDKPETVLCQLDTLNQSTLLLLVTFVITLMTITFSIYHREVFQAVANIIKQATGRIKKECIYDASISYSTSDESLVLNVLRPTLEDGDHKYKLFLNDRELVLGKVMKHYVKESMDRCRKSIVILSKDFVNCGWKNWERANGRILNKNQEKLIFVAREELNRDEVTQKLSCVINEATYLKWPEKSSFDTSEAKNAMVNDEFILEKDLDLVKTCISQKDLLEIFWKDLFKALGDSIFTEVSQRKKVEYKHELDKSEDDSAENDKNSLETVVNEKRQ